MVVARRKSSSGGIVSALVPFSFSTSSPMILGAIGPSQFLARAFVFITVAFNGVLPQFLFGTSGDPDMVLGQEVDLKTIGQYETDQMVQFLVSDVLQLSVIQSSSTQGSGFLFYELRKVSP